MNDAHLIREVDDNRLEVMYLSWGGSEYNAGQKLDKYFNTPDLVKKLFLLGGIKKLGRNIESKMTDGVDHDNCQAYFDSLNYNAVNNSEGERDLYIDYLKRNRDTILNLIDEEILTNFIDTIRYSDDFKNIHLSQLLSKEYYYTTIPLKDKINNIEIDRDYHSVKSICDKGDYTYFYTNDRWYIYKDNDFKEIEDMD